RVEPAAAGSHRHLARLTRVPESADRLGDPPVLGVEWPPADALPVPFCVSAKLPGGNVVDVGVARGNVVPVDHGRTLPPEPVLPDTVPEDGPYRPLLARTPLTFAAPYDPDRPAAEAMRWDVHDALPLALAVVGDDATWTPVFDLLASDRLAPDVAVEVETGGDAQLRFGDGHPG